MGYFFHFQLPSHTIIFFFLKALIAIVSLYLVQQRIMFYYFNWHIISFSKFYLLI